MKDYWQYFPYKKNYPDLIYFDNASTNQKPQYVIDGLIDYFRKPSANPYRGRYNLAFSLKKRIESTKEKIAKFINANPDEIFFTFGSTDGIKKFVDILLKTKSNDQEEILYCPFDHQSLVESISSLKTGYKLIPYDIFAHSGDADWRDILKKTNQKTKVIFITHIHPVFGLAAEPEKLKGKIDEKTIVFLDATQSANHVKIDVKELGIDALVFAGHKFFALEGVGILYLNQKAQKILSIKEFDLGTLPITGIVSLDLAVDFINQIGIENIHKQNIYLTQYLLSKLKNIEKIEFLPGVANARCATGYGIISFKINGLSSDDLSFILDAENIQVRSINKCLNPNNLIDNSIRVSLHINNTAEEIDKFVDILKKIVEQI